MPPHATNAWWRVEQHLVSQEQIGAQEERSAVAELELRDLQLGALAIDDSPILAPVELKRFTKGKGEGHKGTATGGSGAFLLFLSPATRERGDKVAGAGEAQRAEVSVNLLQGSARLARAARTRNLSL